MRLASLNRAAVPLALRVDLVSCTLSVVWEVKTEIPASVALARSFLWRCFDEAFISHFDLLDIPRIPTARVRRLRILHIRRRIRGWAFSHILGHQSCHSFRDTAEVPRDHPGIRYDDDDARRRVRA